MRLEDMSFTDYLMAECDLRERQRKEQMKKAEFEKYAKEHNLFICTTNIIEQIRAELHATAEMHEDEDYYLRDKWVDEIIDKYTNGESE